MQARSQRGRAPEILAKYAYDSVEVPGTEVEMSPIGEQTVNLPTWIGSKGGKSNPVSGATLYPIGTALICVGAQPA